MKPQDSEFSAYLTERKIRCTPLEEILAIDAENRWREIYGRVFGSFSRVREGLKAEHEYRSQACDQFLVVPFTSPVKGLPVCNEGKKMKAYSCQGPLIDLGLFAFIEFFIAPLDFAWTMVHTHEDHSFGGPYFCRQDWLPELLSRA